MVFVPDVAMLLLSRRWVFTGSKSYWCQHCIFQGSKTLNKCCTTKTNCSFYTRLRSYLFPYLFWSIHSMGLSHLLTHTQINLIRSLCGKVVKFKLQGRVTPVLFLASLSFPCFKADTVIGQRQLSALYVMPRLASSSLDEICMGAKGKKRI